MATLWCKSGFILAVSTIFPFVLLILLPAVERTAYFVIDCIVHIGLVNHLQTKSQHILDVRKNRVNLFQELTPTNRGVWNCVSEE